MAAPFVLKDLPGLTKYSVAHQLQKELVEKRIRDEIPDTFIFCEHPPTVTRGSGLQRNTDRAPGRRREELIASELPGHVEYLEIERGGDLTYHAPGQLVLYPIVKLGSENGWIPRRDIGLYIHRLGGWLGDLLAKEGVKSEIPEGATGVWCEEKKIASIGIAVRKWVTYHGMAINVNNDLAEFSMIRPCGFEASVMGRLADLLPQKFAGRDWRERLTSALCDLLE